MKDENIKRLNKQKTINNKATHASQKAKEKKKQCIVIEQVRSKGTFDTYTVVKYNRNIYKSARVG